VIGNVGGDTGSEEGWKGACEFYLRTVLKI